MLVFKNDSDYLDQHFLMDEDIIKKAIELHIIDRYEEDE